jgi:paraquat-inducible protein B
MATAGQVVPFADGKVSPQTEIEGYIDTREKARVALDALIQEIPPAAAKLKTDFAKQAVAQQAGKPKVDTDSLAGLYKSAKAKLDQLQEKQRALETLLEGVKERLEELKKAAPADYILVLDKRIEEQKKVAASEQTEAELALNVLKDLNAERDEILAASPSSAWATTPRPPTITATAAYTSVDPSPAVVPTTIRRGSRKRNSKRGRK